MLVTKESPKFSPVTITLETADEFSAIKEGLRIYSSYISGPLISPVAHQMYERLTRV